MTTEQRSGKFTRGPCTASLEDTNDILLEGGDDVPICAMFVPERTVKENIANVRLMAAAFNAATAAEDQGYDGQAAVEALPEILKCLEVILPMAKGYAAVHRVGSNAEKVDEAETVLTSCRAKESTP